MAAPQTLSTIGRSDPASDQADAKRMLSLAILCPVFNDWSSFERLAHDAGDALAGCGACVRLIAVDDGSSDAAASFPPIDGLRRVETFRLLTNLGHQRAIATGLAELSADPDFDAVIVMDADGEDRPADLPKLLELHRKHPESVILANRSKRSEGPLFRALYFVYKALFWIATGVHIRHGNFSLVPRSALGSILASSSVWNHFAGSILRSRLPKIELDLPRGRRYSGESKMSLVSLVIHGLSAVSVYADVVMVRIVVVSLLIALLSLLCLGAVVAVRYATDLAIPGWATNAGGLALIVLLQNVGLSLIASFILLSLRSQPTFLPLIDARRYVRSRRRLDAETDE